jgi:hypothetical protein
MSAIIHRIKPELPLPQPPKKPKSKAEKHALYVEENGVICKIGEKISFPLCNFSARIIEEVIHDNGEEKTLTSSIEGKLSNGQPLPRIEVGAGSFAGMAWVNSQWGTKVSIKAGNASKDHLRAAIQELSGEYPRRTVYGHTGWREIDGQWLYLHMGGAIGMGGNRTDVEVNPGAGNMQHYRLPDPPHGEDLKAAVRTSLSLSGIAPHKPEIGALLLATVYRAPTATAALIDHTAMLFGYTGARKSEATAMALAHFGQGFDSRHFPAAWVDSAGVLEVKAHAAKDALFVVDDFNPQGGKGDIDKIHAIADKLIRGAGNQAGRGRLQSDLKQRAAYHPRGLVLMTGEDIPRGQSCRARITIASISRDVTDNRKGDIDSYRLTALQEHARIGTLAAAMSGYLQWLAPQMNALKRSLPEVIRIGRDKAIHAGLKGHTRAPSDFASLKAGLALFTDFARQCGAITQAEAEQFLSEASAALWRLIEEQDEHQASQDEVTRFLALLSSALSSGRCHVIDLEGGEKGVPGGNMSCVRNFGWIQDARGDYTPQGTLIGWMDKSEDTLYLDGDAAHAVVVKYAGDQGGNFSLGQRTLILRIYERGLLTKITKTKAGKVEYSVQKALTGSNKRRYALRLSALIDAE